ncbi:hypothetical protein P154DRAFT_516851 [Amniculicola lignicola CBS 123094]|uniref:F-box domain-containing protein n=1 Tax=Amniculicola lignicola CBS 123094 TaxID=1392246 RepID=A0A6A5X5B3_9PLEO|nr:hypothetical protein P154DRAFT_516851 [Amniculicola lignicola CBS 123094]
MASLITLPTELLDQIVLSQLDTPSLSNLSQTSKGFREYCLPKLYADISISRSHLHHQQPSLTFLLRTLIVKPDLGSLIHHLDLRGWIPYKDYINCIPACVLNLALKRTGIYDDSGIWKTELSLGRLDPIIALLLLYTPNLESLKMDTQILRLIEDRTCEAICHGISVKNSHFPISKFDKLRSVELASNLFDHYPEMASSLDIRIFVLTLFFPNIEKIGVKFGCVPCKEVVAWMKRLLSLGGYPMDHYNRGSSQHADFPQNPLSIACHLRQLKLDTMFDSAPILDKLLYQTPKLTHLDFTYRIIKERTTPTSLLNLSSLSDVLHTLHSTLISLRLSVPMNKPKYRDLSWEEFGESKIVSGSLGSLAEFACLKTLDISPLMISGLNDAMAFPTSGSVRSTRSFATLLPPDLKVLRLKDDLYELARQRNSICVESVFSSHIFDVLESCKQIKEIHMQIGGGFPHSEALEKRRTILEMCEREGVGCTVGRGARGKTD